MTIKVIVAERFPASDGREPVPFVYLVSLLRLAAERGTDRDELRSHLVLEFGSELVGIVPVGGLEGADWNEIGTAFDHAEVWLKTSTASPSAIDRLEEVIEPHVRIPDVPFFVADTHRMYLDWLKWVHGLTRDRAFAAVAAVRIAP